MCGSVFRAKMGPLVGQDSNLTLSPGLPAVDVPWIPLGPGRPGSP